jgi:hypothetical protein
MEQGVAATWAEILEFANTQADVKLATIDFHPAEDLATGGTRAFRRTYASATEGFVIDFYSERGDHPVGTGLRVRRKEHKLGMYVWKFAEPPKFSLSVTTTTRSMLETRFNADFEILLRAMPDIRLHLA